MAHATPREVVHHSGSQNKIAYAHFRDVDGVVPSFQETFIDQGNFDEYKLLSALVKENIDGMIIPDHVPKLINKPDWQPTGQGYTIGYIQGMLRSFVD